MEVIFMREQYKNLVPQVTIMAGEHEINLLQAGHRAADAIVRFSDLYQDLREAFEAVRRGDATKLAKIAPTSIVFGVWDSRDTQVKLPRIVRSVIRAFGVKPLHRSAQYIPCVDYVSSGLLEEPRNKEEQDAMSELGLNHVPAPWSHGGIVVEGEIRRDATLNLAALRGLSAVPKDESLQLRRYILGLSLVAFTAPQETFLREGCQLVPDLDRPPEWFVVRHDGRRERISNFTHEQAFEYAKEAATSFGVGEDRSATFNVEAARNAQSKPKEERKRSRRSR
jgi:CRISPR-associated protein Csb1